MPNRISHFIEIIQWTGILTVGFFTSSLFQYADGLLQILWTTVSMGVGAVVSYYIKKWLNRKRKKKQDGQNDTAK